MCPRLKIEKNGVGVMSEEVFKKVINRLKQYNNISYLIFCGNGEPLVHPKITEFVKIAKKNRLNTGLITNGSLLSREKADKLIDIGINNINISFSSNNPDNFKKIHCGSDFEIVKKNIEYVISKKSKTNINLQVSPTQFNKDELPEFIDYWYKKGVDFCFVFEGQHNKGGSIEKKEFIKPDPSSFFHSDAIKLHQLFRPSRRNYNYLKKNVKFSCMLKQNVSFIDWKGNYLLCCMDAGKENVLGNVMDNSIEEINKKKEKLELRDLDICKKCSLRDYACSLPPKDLKFYSLFAKIWLKHKLNLY